MKLLTLALILIAPYAMAQTFTPPVLTYDFATGDLTLIDNGALVSSVLLTSRGSLFTQRGIFPAASVAAFNVNDPDEFDVFSYGDVLVDSSGKFNFGAEYPAGLSDAAVRADFVGVYESSATVGDQTLEIQAIDTPEPGCCCAIAGFFWLMRARRN